MFSADAVKVSKQNISFSACKLRFPTWAKDFLIFRAYRPALGTIQPLIKWTQAYSGPEVKQNTHFHPVPRLRKSGATPQLPIRLHKWRCIKHKIFLLDNMQIVQNLGLCLGPN
jgi:hypothetical protein